MSSPDSHSEKTTAEIAGGVQYGAKTPNAHTAGTGKIEFLLLKIEVWEREKNIQCETNNPD